MEIIIVAAGGLVLISLLARWIVLKIVPPNQNSEPYPLPEKAQPNAPLGGSTDHEKHLDTRSLTPTDLGERRPPRFR